MKVGSDQTKTGGEGKCRLVVVSNRLSETFSRQRSGVSYRFKRFSGG